MFGSTYGGSIFSGQLFSENDIRFGCSACSDFFVTCERGAVLGGFMYFESRACSGDAFAVLAADFTAALLRDPDELAMAFASVGDLGVTCVNFTDTKVQFPAMLAFGDAYALTRTYLSGFLTSHVAAHRLADLAALLEGTLRHQLHAAHYDAARRKLVAASSRISETHMRWQGGCNSNRRRGKR